MKRAIPNVELKVLAEDLSRQAPAQIEKVLARRGAFDSRERPEPERPRSGKPTRKKAPRRRVKHP
jgi:hypothetical protein